MNPIMLTLSAINALSGRPTFLVAKVRRVSVWEGNFYFLTLQKESGLKSKLGFSSAVSQPPGRIFTRRQTQIHHMGRPRNISSQLALALICAGLERQRCRLVQPGCVET